MNDTFKQQQALLGNRIQILKRLQMQLRWSLDRAPTTPLQLDAPEVSERIAAIVARFCKLQDQFAGTLRHAHTMLGEKQRDFQDVITWAVARNLLPSRNIWLELRSLRNRLTHEYELDADRLPELLKLIRDAAATLDTAIARFITLCAQLGLSNAE